MPATLSVLHNSPSVTESNDSPEPVSALLAERLERGWDVPQLVMRLRQVAFAQDVDFPTTNKQVAKLIRAWESGSQPPSARYQRLLCAVYGKSSQDLGLPVPRDGRPVEIDPERWGRIFSRYHSWLLGRIASQVKDFHLAEDLTSETFISVGRSLDKIDPSQDDNLHRWLAMKARWVVTAHYQQQTQNRALLSAPLEDEDDQRQDPAATDPQSQPEDRVCDQDEMLRLLEMLPDQQVKVMLLRMVLDLSLPQIAERLGMSPSAAQRCSTEALATLRRHLGVTHTPKPAPVVPVIDGWTRQARSAAVSEAASGRTFTTNELTERYGLGQPTSPGRWSAVLFELKRDGVIRPAGYAPGGKGQQVRLWVGMTANTAALATAA